MGQKGIDYLPLILNNAIPDPYYKITFKCKETHPILRKPLPLLQTYKPTYLSTLDSSNLQPDNLNKKFPTQLSPISSVVFYLTSMSFAIISV